MKIIFFPLVMVAVLALSACASPTSVSPTQLSASDQAATIVAATMQAVPSNTPTPEPPAELLPHTLYYLGRDGIRDDGAPLTHVYRMERDGKTITRLTNEPNGVDGYDVSLLDGGVAFVSDNQIVLINADGSNRRVLVDGGSARNENNPRFFKEPLSNPVFSPDGQTIAYAHQSKGVILYDLASGTSNVVIKDESVYQSNSPIRYSPDGKKLLVGLGQWETPGEIAVYYLEMGALVRLATGERAGCCTFWSADSSNFYRAVRIPQFAYITGEIQRMDIATGEVTTLIPFDVNNETMNLPDAPYLAPDGWLYYFFGAYRVDSGYVEPPVLQLVRSAPDGVTDRTVLRDENFVLMSEALWSPDAGFVIVAMKRSLYWYPDEQGGVLELYYTDRRKGPVWLAPFGAQMKWGP